jgi:hypothetical protein
MELKGKKKIMHSQQHTKRAHLAGFEPSADTVEVEGMIAHTCGSTNQVS